MAGGAARCGAGAGLDRLSAGLCLAHAEPGRRRRRRPVRLSQAHREGAARRRRDAGGAAARARAAGLCPGPAGPDVRALAGCAGLAGLRGAAARARHLRGLFQRPSARRSGDFVLGGQVGARHAGRSGRCRGPHRQPRRPADEVPARTAPARCPLRAHHAAAPGEHGRRHALHRIPLPHRRRREDLLLAGPAYAGAAAHAHRAPTGRGLAVQQLPPAADRPGARAQHGHAGEHVAGTAAVASQPAWPRTPVGAWTARPPASRSWKAASTRARWTSPASASCSSTRAWPSTADGCCRRTWCATPPRRTAQCRWTSLRPGAYYKHFWWGYRRPDGSYDFSARGNHGQFVYISPKNQVVIARNGRGYGVPPPVWTRLFESLADRLGADPGP